MLAEREKVERIAAVLGLDAGPVSHIGRWATSSAWHVLNRDSAFVVRLIPEGTPRPNTYQSEFNVLRLLRSRGLKVPEPIAVSSETPRVNGVSEPWSVTRRADGRAVGRDRLADGAACELGEFLCSLHEIEMTGFGRLVEASKIVAGQKDTHLAGLLDRWCWAGLWPYDDTLLANHTIVKFRPKVLGHLESLAQEIAELARLNHVSLVHSDLHGEHIFENNGHLSGVIDFGAAFAGLPAFDFGSIAFYHGWDTASRCIEGYTGTQAQVITRQARLLSLVISLYKLVRADGAATSQEKVQRILEFTDETLSAT